MSLEAVPDDKLAAVVTYLEMSAPPALEIPASPLCLERVERPAPDAYRALFRKVGAPWLWFSRLVMPDPELAAILDHPGLELFEVRDGRTVVGMLELDRRERHACEIAFLGLVPELAGRGHGRWLLAEAVARAWTGDARRVHVHTCTLDHPAALAAYRRAGFVAVRRAVEIFVDPRLAGVLPRDAAPHCPLVEPSS